MNERIKREIDLLPHAPGCYLMHNSEDKIIYVGKAKDLYKRVSQYFLRPQSGKVFKMVMEVSYFETIITKTEKEALLLEINLIREHYPRYNILLKDGKSYPFIALKKGNDPHLSIARNDKDKRYDYFGPFPNSSYAYEMISLCNKLFPLRKCKTIPNTPCLYYHMGQCLAPCINKIDEETYSNLRKNLTNFLLGYDTQIKSQLTREMKECASRLDFEKAQEIKELLSAIEHVLSKQSVQTKDHVDRDVIAYSSRDGYLALIFMMYRKGKLLGKELFVVELFASLEDQIASMITQFYLTHNRPKEIVISIKEIGELLEETLNVKVIVPTRGIKYELLQDALRNSINGLDEHFLTARLNDDKMELLEELGKILNIKTPFHIELFDNSHLQGDDSVGAMVAFVNGEKAKKLYRRYHIRHEEKRDDFASMKEVITRRYGRLKNEEGKYPDLILLDGGLSQVKAGQSALRLVGVSIPLFGLYKNKSHQTEGLIDENGNTYPISNKSPLFYLLMRMQDEVHRFAISFHRVQHLKNYKKSLLDDIPNLGKKRQEIIRKAYPTINDLKNASIEELSQLLPIEVSKSLYKKIHENDVDK